MKVVGSVSVYCNAVARGEVAIKDVKWVVSNNFMQTEEDAKQACAAYARSMWHNIITSEQQKKIAQAEHEFLASVGSANEEELYARLLELVNQFKRLNQQKAKEAFWELWRSGKLLQPRIIFQGKLKNKFPTPSGIYSSVDEYAKVVYSELEYRNIKSLNMYRAVKKMIEYMRAN